MSFCTLTISGTLAPPPSRLYYEPILHVCHRHSQTNTYFETIFLLGLGDIVRAVDELDKKYFFGNSHTFVLLGHSQGGLIASLLAMRHPTRVKAVIALATPFKGTTWVDPVNMPIRGAIEAISRLTLGKVRLKPTLRQMIIPILPIVRDLGAHSDVCESIVRYLEEQISGHETFAIIGSNDMLVFPHRSANPIGPLVTSYIVAPNSEYKRLQPVLPHNLEHIDSHAGHLSIVLNQKVLTLIDEIILQTIDNLPAYAS